MEQDKQNHTNTRQKANRESERAKIRFQRLHLAAAHPLQRFYPAAAHPLQRLHLAVAPTEQIPVSAAHARGYVWRIDVLSELD